MAANLNVGDLLEETERGSHALLVRLVYWLIFISPHLLSDGQTLPHALHCGLASIAWPDMHAIEHVSIIIRFNTGNPKTNKIAQALSNLDNTNPSCPLG